MEAGNRARAWAVLARRAAAGLVLAAIVALAAMSDAASASATGAVSSVAQSAPADGPAAGIATVPHRPGLTHRAVPAHVVDLVRPDAAQIEATGRVARLAPAGSAAFDSTDPGTGDARAPPAEGTG